MFSVFLPLFWFYFDDLEDAEEQVVVTVDSANDN